MRGFLILLAVAFPVVLASPSFWSLVAMEWGAAPSTLIFEGGRTQASLIGPRSPWPEWAVVPEGATLRVRAWYGESPPEPSTGFGNLTFEQPSLEMVSAYAARLRAEGWHVDTTLVRTFLPEIQRRELVRCLVRAARHDGADRRVIQATFDLEPRAGMGSIHWATAPIPTWGMQRGVSC